MAERNDTADRELRLTRLLNAPIDLVWEVWTEPAHLAQWWGPNGFTNSISKMDVREGGLWNLIMHGPDGTDYRNESVFVEVIKEKKLVYNHLTGPKFTATVLFEARGEKTHITWHMLFATKEEFIHTVKTFNAAKGLIENGDRLDAYLTKNLTAK